MFIGDIFYCRSRLQQCLYIIKISIDNEKLFCLFVEMSMKIETVHFTVLILEKKLIFRLN